MESFHNRKPQTVLSEEETVSIIENGRVGFLSMAFENWPYCVPVNYVYADGEIYIHSATEGKKIALLEANPPVCFVVVGDHRYIPGECNYFYESAIVYGKAWLINDREQKRRVYEALISKYEPGGGFALTDGCIDDSAIIVIEVDELTGKRKGEVG